MRQIFVVFCLLTCLMIPNSVADSSNQDNWEVDLDNGYISTKPIFVDDQIKPPSSEFKAVTLPSVHATKIMSDQVPHSPCPALMGLVMKECGGAADGKQVSALLREEIMRHV